MEKWGAVFWGTALRFAGWLSPGGEEGRAERRARERCCPSPTGSQLRHWESKPASATPGVTASPAARSPVQG